ncbi:MAG: TRAP transporter substrate-binding protein DctP [Gammaproteobacteria bacterium]|nr:TRAP transporter substrate-binding protein DctP [Gammaproteobacteria bacterium]
MLLRCVAHPGLLLFILLVTAGALAPAAATDDSTLRLTVVSHEPGHFSWAAASRLAQSAGENGLKVEPELATSPGEQAQGRASPDLLLMPLRSLATQVPALEVLELPFLFSGVADIHQAFDNALGKLLREQARQQGWELLALWDEGMHALSGQRRYDRAINLTGMEFILLRPDPVAEKQFKALDAWTRSARPQTREQLLRECAIGSRSASLQQIWHERLDRVHLAVSLTAHRYEGWVVIAPVATWSRHSEKDRAALLKVLSSTTQWQRTDAQRREADALKQLETSGMQIHSLDAEQRAAFMKRLPAWDELLSDELEQSLRKKLIAAATTGVVGRTTGQETPPKAQPATPDG